MRRTFMLGLLAACGGAAVPLAAGPSEQAPVVEWHAYSSAVFERAAREGKMVLLDVGVEGCTACRWMLEDTYADPRVVARMRDHFIAVSIDANAQPDLGERYLRWAWPATIVLTPDRVRLLALRGNRRPRNFLPILDALIAGEPPPDGAGGAPPVERAGCQSVSTRVLAAQHAIGGWGTGFRTVQPEFIHDAFLNPATRDHALRTAEGYSTLLDPVWGGVYIAALDGWTNDFIPEKRLPQQAGAIVAFAHAYALTGDETWLQHLGEVDRYVGEFLWSGDGFYASQRDMPVGAEAARALRGQGRFAYFELDDAGRRALGVPPVDEGVYSNRNGEAVEAYAVAARLLHGTPVFERLAERARLAGARLLRRVDGGLVAQLDGHETAIGGVRLRPGEAFEASALSLETQARVGLAFLALHDLALQAPGGDERWLEAAAAVADATLQHLAQGNGALAASPEARGAPVVAGARAARLFFGLLDRTHDSRWEAPADAALAAASERVNRRSMRALGALALAYRSAGRGLIDVSIAASADEGEPLLRAARAAYIPESIAHVDVEGRYPRSTIPSAFVCTRRACSRPLEDGPELVAAIHAASADLTLCE